MNQNLNEGIAVLRSQNASGMGTTDILIDLALDGGDGAELHHRYGWMPAANGWQGLTWAAGNQWTPSTETIPHDSELGQMLGCMAKVYGVQTFASATLGE